MPFTTNNPPMRATRSLRRKQGPQGSRVPIAEMSFRDVRATVDEIHMSSLAEAGVSPAAEGAPAESEEDSEEMELEEAQAQAEALLAAEAGETGTADARAEVVLLRQPPDTRSVPRVRDPVLIASVAGVAEAAGDSRVASRMRFQRSAIY